MTIKRILYSGFMLSEICLDSDRVYRERNKGRTTMKVLYRNRLCSVAVQLIYDRRKNYRLKLWKNGINSYGKSFYQLHTRIYTTVRCSLLLCYISLLPARKKNWKKKRSPQIRKLFNTLYKPSSYSQYYHDHRHVQTQKEMKLDVFFCTSFFLFCFFYSLSFSAQCFILLDFLFYSQQTIYKTYTTHKKKNTHHQLRLGFYTSLYVFYMYIYDCWSFLDDNTNPNNKTKETIPHMFKYKNEFDIALFKNNTNHC